MKLQSFSIWFIIIVLPISLVLGVYCRTLMNVQVTESKYKTMLQNATYDALRAYQLNDINNKFTGNKASNEKDILGSINTFYKSLATSMGQSRFGNYELSSYTPAIMYTMYDGFYIYGPYRNYAKIEQKEVKRLGIESKYYLQPNLKDPNKEGDIDIEYGLKPYIYYTCKYTINHDDNVIVNYTMDNYISVMGTYKGEYIARAGYYINPNNVYNINDEAKTLTLKRKGDKKIDIGPEELGEFLKFDYDDTKSTDATTKYYRYILMNNTKYYKDSKGTVFYVLRDKRIDASPNLLEEIKKYLGQNSFDNWTDISAFNYYKTAKEFSDKVHPMLKEITIAKTEDGTYSGVQSKEFNAKYVINYNNLPGENHQGKYTAHQKFDYGKGTRVFDYTIGDNDPEDEDSVFNQHRLDVIISSIEYSLIVAIQGFNEYSESTDYVYKMPTLSEEDWYKIGNSETVCAFLEGLPVKNYKFFSDYAIISNSKCADYCPNNDIIIQEQYSNSNPPQYTKANNKFHGVGCNKLKNGNYVGYRTIEHEAVNMVEAIRNEKQMQHKQELKRTVYFKHPEPMAYRCYVTKFDDTISLNDISMLRESSTGVQKAYISAIAREKYNQFKTGTLLEVK